MKKALEVKANCDVPALWLEHKNALQKYIRKRVSDKQVAEDLLQEVLMKVYNFCLSTSGVKNIRSWLFQIAHNTIIDHHRKQQRLSYEIPDIEAEEENKAYGEATEFILPILAFLPEEYAVPLKLSDIDGMKQAEVAQKLGLTLSAVKSRIQRARVLLKAEFATCCHLETDREGQLVSFNIKESCKPLQDLIKNSDKK